MKEKIMILVKSRVKKGGLLYRLLLFLFDPETRIQFVLRRIVGMPDSHCHFLVSRSNMFGFGSLYPRSVRIDLQKPSLFHEKLLWLKYHAYNSHPSVALCYDKFLVRDYVRNAGCGNALNELFGVWDRVEEIPWTELPANCVLKITNGCGNHVFKRAGVPFDVDKARTILFEALRVSSKKMIASGSLFASKMPQRIICEKLLTSNFGYSSPEDFKFYCFHGEPVYLLYIWDRLGEVGYQQTFKRVDFADVSHFFKGAVPRSIEPPACYAEMLEICRKLAGPFPFVRVDLYVNEERPIFGELTFTPAGGYVPYHIFDNENQLNFKALSELGERLLIRG